MAEVEIKVKGEPELKTRKEGKTLIVEEIEPEVGGKPVMYKAIKDPELKRLMEEAWREKGAPLAREEIDALKEQLEEQRRRGEKALAPTSAGGTVVTGGDFGGGIVVLVIVVIAILVLLGVLGSVF